MATFCNIQNPPLHLVEEALDIFNALASTIKKERDIYKHICENNGLFHLANEAIKDFKDSPSYIASLRLITLKLCCDYNTKVRRYLKSNQHCIDKHMDYLKECDEGV